MFHPGPLGPGAEPWWGSGAKPLEAEKHDINFAFNKSYSLT